jgi:nucleoside-diphosphate-sugar epimerase
VRVVVTGASGFLGGMLAERLVRTRALGGVTIDRLVLADQVTQSNSALAADPLVEVVRGDMAACCQELFAQPVDLVFHLAAAVSAACEADFELGLHANVDATRAVLDAARAQAAGGGPVVRLVFASSIAVYGSSPDLPLPAVVSETTLPLPQSSYGTQKLIGAFLRGYPRLQPGEETKMLRSRAGGAGSPPGRTGVRRQPADTQRSHGI